MAPQKKGQQLLGKMPEVKKPKASPKKKQQQQQEKNQQLQREAQAAQAAQQARKSKTAVKKKSGIVKKLMNTILGLIVLAAIIAPKPQLLIYKKLNLVASSIYIPGFFGSPGRLLDSPQAVIIDKPMAVVYLCFGQIADKTQCNNYQFIEQKGMFSALGHYLAQQP
jgi:hypothetical protein